MSMSEMLRSHFAIVFGMLTQTYPIGGRTDEEIHVFTYADQDNPHLCHLARSVEAAGGYLRVLGLRDGKKFKIPKRAAMSVGAEVQEKERWHFAEKGMLLKRFIFLKRAISRLSATALVVFVDGFDVLFQRPLLELAARYRRIAGPAAQAAGGIWPVLLAGELNCYPFPHGGEVHCSPRKFDAMDCWPFKTNPAGKHSHKIRPDAVFNQDYRGRQSYYLKDDNEVHGNDICGVWFARWSLLNSDGTGEAEGQEEHLWNFDVARFPFLNSGTYMGTVTSLKRLLHELFSYYDKYGEDHDQALLTVLLLRNRTLGLIDTQGHVFLPLHGYSQSPEDLQRALCRRGYFRPRNSNTQPWSANLHHDLMGPTTNGSAAAKHLFEAMPPAFNGDEESAAPMMLHFNGNGKRYQPMCIREFQAAGILAGYGRGPNYAACSFWDGDAQRMVSHSG